MKPVSENRHLWKFCSVPNMLALGCLAAFALGGWWVLTQSRIDLANPNAVIKAFGHSGWVGVVAYIALVTLAIIVGPIPSTPFTIAAGAVWGGIPAGIYGTVGLFLGSVAAYFIGRTLGRTAVKALTGKVLHLSNHRGEQFLGWLVFFSHAFPILPSELVSYGAGISGMNASRYAFNSLLGIIPSTFLLTNVGSALTMNLPLAIALGTLFLSTIIILPWGIKRHNWWGLRDVVRFE